MQHTRPDRCSGACLVPFTQWRIVQRYAGAEIVFAVDGEWRRTRLFRFEPPNRTQESDGRRSKLGQPSARALSDVQLCLTTNFRKRSEQNWMPARSMSLRNPATSGECRDFWPKVGLRTVSMTAQKQRCTMQLK